MPSSVKSSSHLSSDTWDESAASYQQLRKKFGSINDSACDYILKRLHADRPFSSSTTILDIGCGPGVGIERLAEQFCDTIPVHASLKAIDFSPGMIRLVLAEKQQRIQAGGDVARFWTQVEAEVLDVMDMDRIASNSVSHALSNFVLFGVADSEKALGEVARVLEPGGVFAMTSFVKTGWVECMRSLQQVTTKKLPFPQFDPSNPWANIEGVKAKLDNAGFDSAAAEIFDVVLEIEDIKQFPYDMFDVPALAGIQHLLTAEEKEQGCELVTARLKKDHTSEDGKVRLTGTCILGWGSKAKRSNSNA